MPRGSTNSARVCDFVRTNGHGMAADAVFSRPARRSSSSAMGNAAAHVLSWGHGAHGQLGQGGTRIVPTPRRIESLAGRGVVCVAAGGLHSLALTEAGDVFSCGSNSSGQLGIVDATMTEAGDFVVVGGLPPATLVACGDAHSAALTRDGQVYTWGCRTNGRLGRDGPGPVPGRVVLPARVVSIACGGERSAPSRLAIHAC